MQIHPTAEYLRVRNAAEGAERNIWEIIDPADVEGAKKGGLIVASSFNLIPTRVDQFDDTVPMEGLIHVSDIVALVEA